jgi:hypothetical protein
MPRPRLRFSQSRNRLFQNPWLICGGAIALLGSTVWTARYLNPLVSPQQPLSQKASRVLPPPTISLQPYLIKPVPSTSGLNDPTTFLDANTTQPQPDSTGMKTANQRDAITNAAENLDQFGVDHSGEEFYAVGSSMQSPNWDAQTGFERTQSNQLGTPQPQPRSKPKAVIEPTAPPIIPVAPPQPPKPPQPQPVLTPRVSSNPMSARQSQFNVQWPNRKVQESY